MKDYRREIVEELKRDRKPVVIYGAGKFAINTAQYILDHGISILGFWDLPEYYFDGKKMIIRHAQKESVYEVYNEEKVNKIKEPFNMLLGRGDYRLLEPLRLKCPKCKIVEYLDGFASHIMDMEFIEHNRKAMEKVYELLCDKESREVMKSYVYARLSGDVRDLSKLNHGKWSYDYELLKLKDNDIVVDAGAYNGDTIREMEEYINGKVSYIYAFEPDNNSYKLLRKNVEGNAHIDCINAGLWDRSGTLHFDDTCEMTSKITEEVGNIVSVYSLDEFFGDDKKVKATLIKMDIEGAELNALKGCEKFIISNRPKLAICIYRKNEDLITLPLFLKSIVDNHSQVKYRFYLRQHKCSVEETVLYAVPYEEQRDNNGI